MSIKTLAYVALALAVCYGLLKLAWNVSETVLKPEEQEISQPQPAKVPKVEPKLQTGTAGSDTQGADTAAQDQNASSQPESAGEVEPKDDAAERGYYDDSIQTSPSAVKQHRVDKKDPYAPDEREAVDKATPKFPTDDREVDRSQSSASDEPTISPDAYAPDPHEVD